MTKPCGCCSGIHIATPQTIYNRPGLPALNYRVGMYATFLESMLARLSTMYVDTEPALGPVKRLYPLKDLTTRDLSDPSIALLDAWAVVADVLTFYQERIVNEGYLATATERLSIIELARLIGYRPRPGVAASVFLAFTTATGFSGEIPAGTRAQSIPGPGETAQFFETSAKLVARDGWNSLGPRLTRPQVITPLPQFGTAEPKFTVQNHLGTNADIVDGVYFQGIATNLKAGDPVLLVTSDGAGQQVLRFAEDVESQANQGRTHVALREDGAASFSSITGAITDTLLRFIYDAPDQFPGSDLAANTAALLSNILAVMDDDPSTATSLARAAESQIQTAHDVAVTRGFTRVETWLQHLLDAFPGVIRALTELADRSEDPIPPRPSVTSSSLERLYSVLPAINIDRSVPPFNPLRLGHSVEVAFASHADTLPRLVAVLNPVAAPLVYPAWGNVQPVHFDLEIYALRARASLFASSFSGKAKFDDDGNSVGFDKATLDNTWRNDLLPDVKTGTSLSVIALDAVYDKITANSWIAVSRPNITDANTLGSGRTVTYHQVTDVQTASLDTTTGFTAKVSVLTLNSAWLTAQDAGTFVQLLQQALLLRGTIVYAQSEALELAEEPLDRDIAGDSIELDGLYDGLEPGRWVIVSGERTDIPNVAGVDASEITMISAVTQGVGKEACTPFLPKFVPFNSLYYISDENAAGDRLIVGEPTDLLPALLKPLPEPSQTNQQYCETVELCPGVYADAYVPTGDEKTGNFSPFADQLIDPTTGKPFSGGIIPTSRDDVFAWRIRRVVSASESVHTTIQLATALNYKYNAGDIKIYANVAKATHGQTTGEILGDGDGSQAFQRFALHQKPLTYLSAPTPEGAESTLTVRVNDIEWHETDTLAALGPTEHEYVTQTNDSDQTTIIFGNGEHGARVPTGNSNVKATYRYGIGSPGNVAAGQISQLATHPLGLQGVINPLAATGGADRDTIEQARSNAPLAVMALDRLVSIQDYADFARTWDPLESTCRHASLSIL